MKDKKFWFFIWRFCPDLVERLVLIEQATDNRSAYSHVNLEHSTWSGIAKIYKKVIVIVVKIYVWYEHQEHLIYTVKDWERVGGCTMNAVRG